MNYKSWESWYWYIIIALVLWSEWLSWEIHLVACKGWSIFAYGIFNSFKERNIQTTRTHPETFHKGKVEPVHQLIHRNWYVYHIFYLKSHLLLLCRLNHLVQQFWIEASFLQKWIDFLVEGFYVLFVILSVTHPPTQMLSLKELKNPYAKMDYP